MVHVTIDPLKAILALSHTHRWQSGTLIPRRPAEPLPGLVMALYYWIATSQIIDFYADVNIPVHKIATTIEKEPLLAFLQSADPSKVQTLVDIEQHMAATTWDKLDRADSFAARIACQLAVNYGYECPLDIPLD